VDNLQVRYSRAGDAFHYRWAARRCLRLVELNSPLRCITIEGSKESKQAGEYAIDLAEYSESDAAGKTTVYYQLKHSTVRTSRDFVFSEFSPTLKQFGKRYSAAVISGRKQKKPGSVRFSLVTNRPIADQIKKAVAALRVGKRTTMRRQFETATGLKGEALHNFCAVLSLIDGEGDYLVQKHALRGEMADYLAGAVEGNEVEGLIGLVIDRALPASNGEIVRENVLQRLGVTSDRQLFPAKPHFETLSNPIKREQHEAILRHILASTSSTVLHASGGVGKSVVARQLVESLPPGSWGLVYDCFGAGNYRNPSQSRHQARDALVQIANEMAVAGLCRPLIARVNESSRDLFQGFLDRLKQGVTAIRTANADAILLVVVDAADNAEMAAADFGDEGFAHALLREPFPEGCRLVELCRTERIRLLQAPSTVHQYQLSPFSPNETAAHLRTFFPSASQTDAAELHRLTGGNPRVQANALAGSHESVTELLNSLGPAGTTVEDQIQAQLEAAISVLKDKHPQTFANEVNAICLGLANLPPFVPLDILAAAAGVEVSAIHSFVSDLGRPLWLSDDAVQFRDEPTETWFRKNFGAEKTQIKAYITALEPIATTSTYAAKALPQLLHRAEEHAQLIELALSDRFLPQNNPIDARNIRVYRLQFAFKAALKLKRFADACRLAFRAGEEVAGDRRQMELLAKNADLVPRLQSVHRVQELAYRSMLRADWAGSENVYSASLLSSVDAFKGEARGYIRGAEKWLRIYFEQRTAQKEPYPHQEALQDEDVVELAWAHFNLLGPAGAVRFLLRFKPPEFIFRTGRLFIRRLVDHGRFDEVDETARRAANHPYLILAVADELGSVCKFPPKETMRHTLNFLATKKTKIKDAGRSSYETLTTTAVLSLCEAAAAQRLPRSKIRTVLDKYTVPFAHTGVADDHFKSERRAFLRGASLRSALDREAEPSPETFIPPKDENRQEQYDRQSKDKQLKEVIGALLPWYFLRARLLCRDAEAESIDLEEVRSRAKAALQGRYRRYDPIPYEISSVRFEVLALRQNTTGEDFVNFAGNVLGRADEKFYLYQRLRATRTAFRLAHLKPLRERLEQSCRKTIEGTWEDGPEERANAYISLARAVIPQSHPDATAYFSKAVEAVSKFGDEIGDRWQAVIAVAKRATSGNVGAELTYRFLRCGEMVQETNDRVADHADVLRVAVNLHAPSAFSALSRWRDRARGWFDEQIRALTTESVQQDILSSSSAFCFTGFLGCNGKTEYSELCVSKAHDRSTRELILRMALRDAELADVESKELQKLRKVAAEFPAEDARIADRIAKSAATAVTRPRSRVGPFVSPERVSPAVRIDPLLHGIDVLDKAELNRAIEVMEGMEPPREPETFWTEVISRVPLGREADFLEVFLALKETSYFEAGHVIAKIQASWRGKAAVERDWDWFLTEIGKRFAFEFTNSYRLTYWRDQYALTENDLAAVRNGIFDRLAESVELVDAATFFGFVWAAVSRLEPTQAVALLDYSLGRFEKHIPTDFGDGEWSEWLRPPDAVSEDVAGLIWSALGSPYSSHRWQAAHCVRRLADLGCADEIAALVRWMEVDAVGSFGSKRYPFYRLHARLYALIAFARAAIDHPRLLQPHSRFFASVALEGIPHILIQKNAAEIAVRIEEAMPGTYEREMLVKLRKVGVSPLPARTVIGYNNTSVDTPWHARGEVDLTIKLFFDFDFDRYWFNQLGSVFGVPNEQVEDLAREIAVRQLGIPARGDNDGYQPDPRLHQWNSGDFYERGTSHDHGSYPWIDTHSFYYSYHSFLCAAAKLLEHVPVVIQTDYWDDGDKWAEFLSRHSITRLDGRWLADRRDPAPIKRRSWVQGDKEEHWRWRVQRDDFIDVVVNQSSGPGFLCVSGYWTDYVDDRIEQLRVRSALVNSRAAQSLATALREAESVDFNLPSYGSQDCEFLTPPFELIGWIKQRDGGDGRLDRFDPHAREIYYPPEEVGETHSSLLELSADYEKREWSRAASTPSVIVEIWSSRNISRREDEPSRLGDRMSASLDLLKQLCAKSGKDLIFSVEINRSLHRDYRSRSRDEDVYTISSHKIFLFSSDGIVRDTTETYQPR
jgi:hypothetical protein